MISCSLYLTILHPRPARVCISQPETPSTPALALRSARGEPLLSLLYTPEYWWFSSLLSLPLPHRAPRASPLILSHPSNAPLPHRAQVIYMLSLLLLCLDPETPSSPLQTLPSSCFAPSASSTRILVTVLGLPQRCTLLLRQLYYPPLPHLSSMHVASLLLCLSTPHHNSKRQSPPFDCIILALLSCLDTSGGRAWVRGADGKA